MYKFKLTENTKGGAVGMMLPWVHAALSSLKIQIFVFTRLICQMGKSIMVTINIIWHSVCLNLQRAGQHSFFWYPCGWSFISHSRIFIILFMRSADTLSGSDGDVIPFGVLSSAGGWSMPSCMWAIVMFQTVCRCFASAEILISFFACVTSVWCLSPLWWLFASRL